MALADELKTLHDLHEAGKLTDQEYTDAKAATLGKQVVPQSTVAPPTKSPKSRTIGRFLGLSLILLLILAIGFFWYNSSTTNTSTLGSGSRPLLNLPVPQVRSVPITDTALTVSAVSYSWIMFSVPPDSTMVAVNGHFAATGGSGNDIQVYVLTEDGFVNFKNNHEAQSYYNSGRETEGTISATLPNQSATYYLVFDNRFSLLTPKAVTANATLTYTQ